MTERARRASGFCLVEIFCAEASVRNVRNVRNGRGVRVWTPSSITLGAVKLLVSLVHPVGQAWQPRCAALRSADPAAVESVPRALFSVAPKPAQLGFTR